MRITDKTGNIFKNWSVALIASCIFINACESFSVNYKIKNLENTSRNVELNATCGAEDEIIIVENDLTTLIAQPGSACNTEFRMPRLENVCQLKLEFRTFKIAQPSFLGNCETDYVAFKASNLNPNLTICGNNGDNHCTVYLHYGDTFMITVGFSIQSMESAVEILVKQIKCNDQENQAPQGCTQYFSGSTGIVRGFNHEMQQLNNQMYSACVKGAHDLETVSWSKCSTNPDDFHITTEPFLQDETKAECTTDYVTIPGSANSKYCRMNSFDCPVTSFAKPFIIYVNMDSEELKMMEAPEQGRCPRCFTEDPLSPDVCIPDPDQTDCSQDDYFNTGFCLRYTLL